MIVNKKIFIGFLVLLFLGTNAFFLGNTSNIFLPVTENTAEEENSSSFALKDISENNWKSSFHLVYQITENIKVVYIVLFYLLITFFFFKLLTKSSLTPRLPPLRQ